MFSGENNCAFYCVDSAMSNNTSHCWSYNQNQKYFSNVETGNNYHDKLTWPNSLPNNKDGVSYKERSIFYEVNNIQNVSSLQYSSVQCIPQLPELDSYPVFQTPSQKQHTRPLLHINVVQSKNGDFKAIVKGKRKRTVFTKEHVEALEEIYKRKQYLTREERQVVVSQIKLGEKPVKTWFQNRRMKNKKDPNAVEIKELRRVPDISQLEYVESQIHENTDEFGYVTLKDGLMKNLCTVMDEVLSHNMTNTTLEEVTCHDCPMYEPISPANTSDSNDDDNTIRWEPVEPSESLQILFDLQSKSSFKY